MATEVTNYKCPACTGPLHFVGASGKLECDYCGSSYEVAEIEAMLAEKNEEAVAASAAAAAKTSDGWNMDGMSEDWGGDAKGMKTYSCPSCGAELICDANTAATCCPYCGNQTVVPSQFSGSLKPELVIPFKTDKEAAIAALKRHYQGKKLLPKSFADGNHIEEVQGVYVPFWMFDCVATGEVQFEGTTSTTRDVGDKRITTTRHFDVRRTGKLAFEKVPVDASTRMPDGHMDSIEPYDYSQLKPFSMAYMPGFLADKYDVTAEESGKRMEERCVQTFVNEVEKSVTEYDTISRRGQNVRVRKGAAHYAMLPVWLLATKWNDQNFLFAMNGQTGKLVGDLPVDKGKYWGYFGGIGAVLILIMQLLNNFVFSKPMTGFAMGLICIALPLLITLIVCASFKAQMKSIHTQRAAAYIAGLGLQITGKRDAYTNTTTETKVLNTAKK